MGITYHAVDTNLGSAVALKVISARYSGDAKARERFRREARAAAQLHHPNVASVFHFGQTPDDQCFYAMELVEGETLEARIRRDGPFPLASVLDVAEQVARALAAAASHGLVHRDLKPSNIMVVANDSDDADGLTVKVIDFGLARVVTEATNESHQAHPKFSGTPGFASPEQLAAGDVALDSRSDIYSLGTTLCLLLTGKPPFVGRTLNELREEQLREPLRLPELAGARLPASVIALLRSMLAADPAQRPQSARELLSKLRRCRQQVEVGPRRRRLAAVALLVICVLGLTGLFWSRHHLQKLERLSGLAPTEKSIAVLPFENLSNDREDAFFADGVQDDLLTKLAKIRDLKVISRTSVMQYAPRTEGRDMRQIGSALRVSYVLAGSVRKTGSWLHINAQLIDTANDSHVWVEQYDRDLKEVFAIQSEIAQKVAEQLHADVSPAERLAIQRPPTADLTAFDLYSRARNLLLATSFTTGAKPSFLQAIDLLNQAVEHDPAFFQAYCQLAEAHEQLYLYGIDRTPTRLVLADTAIEAALRLRPEAGEAHLARAGNLYMGYLNYDGALAELALADQTLPNDPKVYELKGYILRRQGKQEEALQNLKRAVELDPRSFATLLQVALSYEYLRRYAEEKETLDRALTIEPDDTQTKVIRAQVELDWKADTRPVHQIIDEIRAKNPTELENVADNWLICALAERDPVAATDALNALGENKFGFDILKFSRLFVEGLIARMTKDDAKALAAFTAAREEQEQLVQAQPDRPQALCVLGLIDAALGQKEKALAEGRRAVQLLPVEKDALNGSGLLYYFAILAAWTGENQLACEQLAKAIPHSREANYGHLKLSPFWDPLRGDACFENIVASLGPK
jgi:serine/threonine-protein kinase